MADDKMNTPESPENWQEYSRLLQGLPAMKLPEGFEGRLDAALGRDEGGQHLLSVGADLPVHVVGDSFEQRCALDLGGDERVY